MYVYYVNTSPFVRVAARAVCARPSVRLTRPRGVTVKLNAKSRTVAALEKRARDFPPPRPRQYLRVCFHGWCTHIIIVQL